MTLEGGWLVCTGSLHESQADTGPNYLSPVFGHSRGGAKAQELKAQKHKYKYFVKKNLDTMSSFNLGKFAG